MNRDGGAYNLPTTYDRILVTCLSSMSRDHMPDKVRGRRVAIRYRFCVWLCNMNVIIVEQVLSATDRPAPRAALSPSCCTQRWMFSVRNW